MHYYQFNIGDYAGATQHLEPMEDLAYRRMLDLYYSKESPLPLDVNQIARLIRMRSHSDCIAVVLDEFFTKEKDGWHNKGADKALSKVYKKSEAARKSAEARWNKNKDLESCERNANASDPHSERNANGMLPNTHNPIPNTQDTNKDLRFDFEAVAAVWNECCLESETPSRKSKVVTEATKKSLPTTYKKYCAIKKKGGKEPASRIDFCKSYFPAVLNWGAGFVGKSGPNENWKMNLEHAAKVGTYDKVVEWLSDD